uniref:Uncharacterized protein n=1 Tax=Parascaris equorum TaxID=6256 RepID=A0A914S778_PAREQ
RLHHRRRILNRVRLVRFSRLPVRGALIREPIANLLIANFRIVTSIV